MLRSQLSILRYWYFIKAALYHLCLFLSVGPKICTFFVNLVCGRLNFSIQIKEPTRYSKSGGAITSTMIDLIFTNSDSIQQVKVLDINVSDHLAVMITRKKI